MAWGGKHETYNRCVNPLPLSCICWPTRAVTAADLTVGAGFDTGTQGAILSVGTNDNLIDRTRIGGKDVSAKGEAGCLAPRSVLSTICDFGAHVIIASLRRYVW